jgi:S-formylglutathione hydrolase FrmB
MRCRLALTVVLLAVLAPGTAHAQQLLTIPTPSKYVDETKANFSAPGPHKLQANVLLPDGYDKHKRYPLLLLLHGAGERWDSWARPERGNVAEIAKNLDAIIVMPEAAVGFYSNWYNGGRYGDPQWERYFFDELIPLIERKFPIRAGRRWHAIAGFSMAGFGSSFLASQRPGYFGTVAPFSGFVSVQRPENDLGLTLFSGVNYQQIFGPPGGFYAAGHNPVALAPNLANTRAWVSTGNGIPRPGVEGDLTDVVSGALELVLVSENQDFVDALKANRAPGVPVNFRVHLGNHSFPYWREDLRDLIAYGLFNTVPTRPGSWTYKTVARTGQAWDLKYAFARPPDRLITFNRRGAELVAEGAGEVTIRTSRECVFTAALPFRHALSGRLCRRLRVTLSSDRVKPGTRRRIGVKVTTVDSGARVPAPRAKVVFGGRSKRTDSHGRTSFLVSAGPVRRTLVFRATRDESLGASASLRVR